MGRAPGCGPERSGADRIRTTGRGGLSLPLPPGLPGSLGATGRVQGSQL